MKKFDVADIGIIVADIPVKIPYEVLDFTHDTIRVEKLELLPGGDAANSAIILAQLGKKVALSGALGDDGMGQMVRDVIGRRGVDVGYVRMKEGVKTSASAVLINSRGERTFVCTRGNNGTLCARDVDETLIGEARHINLSSLFAHPLFEQGDGPALFERAKNSGMTISADAAHDNYGTGFEGAKNLLRFLDIFMPSYAEAKYISGENEPGRMAEFIADRTGEKVVVIKLGAEGCYVRDKGRGYQIPAFQVDAVDTTGAGDNFLAGFLSAYLDGAPIEDCARLACATAAVSVMHLGATSPATTLESARMLMEAQGKKLF